METTLSCVLGSAGDVHVHCKQTHSAAIAACERPEQSLSVSNLLCWDVQPGAAVVNQLPAPTVVPRPGRATSPPTEQSLWGEHPHVQAPSQLKAHWGTNTSEQMTPDPSFSFSSIQGCSHTLHEQHFPLQGILMGKGWQIPATWPFQILLLPLLVATCLCLSSAMASPAL